MPIDTTEFFRIKNGLTINEDELIIDGATGDIDTQGNIDLDGNLTVGGNLTVNGTTTTLNTTELNIEDNQLTLNAGVTGAPTLDAGIKVERGDEADVDIRWNESTNKWQFTNDGSNYKDFVVEDTNTVYSLTAEDSTATRKAIRLTGSDVSEDDVGLIAGSNLTISRNNNDITLATTATPTFTTVTANLTGNVTGTVSSLSNHTTDNLNEGSTNQYFTNSRSRLAISATDSGGDGSLSYDNNTGVITYTGPSATEVRAHFTAGTGVTLTNGQISIGQAVGTTDNPTFAGATLGNITVGVATDNTITTTANDLILDSATDMIDIDADVSVLGNKSIAQGTGPYAGSTDIYRDNSGAAVEGLLISNNAMTNSDSQLVIRTYGQTLPGGTSTTAGPAKISLVGTRGTAASPLANNNGSNLGQLVFVSNLGDTTGGGTGSGFTNDLFADREAQPAGIFGFANQNHRQTLQATFTADIAGTTMTVTAVASGTIRPGQEVRGTGFAAANAAYVIIRQISSTAASNALGSTGTYEVGPVSPGTIASSTMTTYTIASGAGVRLFVQPLNYPTSIATFIGPVWTTSGTGNHTVNITNNTFGQSWFSFPAYYRTITEITNGDTLNIGTHGMTATGASFTITTAGNPNGLTTNTTYFVDAIPSSTTIKLRTNSNSGGAVTGLTNGSGLFIEAGVRAVSSNGSSTLPSNIALSGFRRGHTQFAGLAQDNTRQNDWLGEIRFTGGLSNNSQNNATKLFGRARQDWSAGNFGSEIVFQTTKDSTNTTYASSFGASATTLNTDSFNINNTTGGSMVAINSAGLLTTTGSLQINGNSIRNSTGDTTITMNTGANAVTIFSGDIRIDGNDIRANDASVNISLNSNISTTFAGDIQINGGDILNSTGNFAVRMASGSSPLITFPGNIQLNSGAIKNSLGDDNITLGSTFTNINAKTVQFRGAANTGDDSNIQFTGGTKNGSTIGDRNTSFALFHRRNPAQTGEYPNAGFNNWILNPSTGNYQANLSGETLGELQYSGQYSTTSTPQGNGPAVSFSAKAAENFSNTANGGRAAITVTKIGTANNKIDALSIDSSNAYVRSDTTYIQKADGTTLQKFDATESWYRSGRFVYGQVVGGSTIFDITDNGSTGITSVYSNPYATSTTGVGNVTIAVSNTQSLIDLNAFSTDGSNVAGVMFDSTRRSGGNNAPTQLGDRLGQLRFNGNTNTGTGQPTHPVTGGEIRVQASENWTGSATGTQIGLEVTKTGTTSNVTVFLSDSISTEVRGDTIELADSTGSDYITINSNMIDHKKPLRSSVVVTGTVAKGADYTPAQYSSNYHEVEITNTGTGTGVFIDVTNLTTAGQGGMYSFLVYNNSGSNMDITLKNNGVTGAQSMKNLANGDREMITVYCVGNYASAEAMSAIG